MDFPRLHNGGSCSWGGGKSEYDQLCLSPSDEEDLILKASISLAYAHQTTIQNSLHCIVKMQLNVQTVWNVTFFKC